MNNQDTHYWACKCGQMNLLTDRECRACGGSKDECWDPKDRRRMVIAMPVKPEDKERIVGFDV